MGILPGTVLEDTLANLPTGFEEKRLEALAFRGRRLALKQDELGKRIKRFRLYHKLTSGTEKRQRLFKHCKHCGLARKSVANQHVPVTGAHTMKKLLGFRHLNVDFRPPAIFDNGFQSFLKSFCFVLRSSPKIRPIALFVLGIRLFLGGVF